MISQSQHCWPTLVAAFRSCGPSAIAFSSNSAPGGMRCRQIMAMKNTQATVLDESTKCDQSETRHRLTRCTVSGLQLITYQSVKYPIAIDSQRLALGR